MRSVLSLATPLLTLCLGIAGCESFLGVDLDRLQPLDGGRRATILAANIHTPWAIAADEFAAYWVASGATVGAGTVSSIPVRGGHVVNLVHNQADPMLLAMGWGSLCWANSSTGELCRAPLDGTNPRCVYGGGGHIPGGVALDATDAYYTSSNGGGIFRVPADPDRPREVLYEGQWGVHGLAVEADRVYWTIASYHLAGGAAGAVLRAPKSGGGLVETLASGQNPLSLVVDEQWIYWVDAGRMVSGGCQVADGQVHRLGKTGQGHLVLAENQACPRALALDGQSLYWANYGVEVEAEKVEGAIMKVDLTSLVVDAVAPAARPAGVAVNSQSVFFTEQRNGSDGVIGAMPK